MNKNKNLVPWDKRDPEERKAFGRKGGITSGRSRRAKATLTSKLKALLACKIDDGTGTLARCDELLAEDIITRALNGDYKYVRLLLEYSEGKPIATTRVEMESVPEETEPTQFFVRFVKPDGSTSEFKELSENLSVEERSAIAREAFLNNFENLEIQKANKTRHSITPSKGIK